MITPDERKAGGGHCVRVEALYHEILARPSDERDAALLAACPDDPALAAEVRSLLEQPESAVKFLSAPALEVAARLVSGARSTFTGQRLGVYEIQCLLGVGGMGEVYRAKDTRLGRSVAIKILPRAFRDDPDRLSRFEREARTLASLSHPHICALYDVGRETDTNYLVMELVQGETLGDRIKRGHLPLDLTLRTAIEIASALDRAHRQGVIHRDLKPGNVMLTKSGTKLMDFGLAKLSLGGSDAGGGALPETASEPLTGEGTVMGTIPYMAPEQLEGKGADARSDLWALGCVLYEMVTGRRAFEGKSRASLMTAIMTSEPPPVSQLQPLIPLALGRLVMACLARDPDDRMQTAHDVMQQLKWIAETAHVTPSAGSAVVSAEPRRRFVVGAVALLAALSIGVVIGRSLLRPAPSLPPAVHATLDVEPAEQLSSGRLPGGTNAWPAASATTALTWTPDGRSLVFVGQQAGVQRIYVRNLDSDQARPLSGTEGAYLPTISPDGRWVAFWSGAPKTPESGRIQRIPITGGPAATIIDDVPAPHGMAWGTDGRIFYGPADCGAERRVICAAEPERGATPLTRRTPGRGQSEMHTLPHLLPGGEALIYTVRRSFWSWGDEEIVAHVFATGQTRPLLMDAVDARYVPSGHLAFLRRGILFGVRFDLARIATVGTAIPVLDEVSQALTSFNSNNITGAGQFSVASTGTLAWIRGGVISYREMNLVKIDRTGRVEVLEEQPQSYNVHLALSPDGKKLVVSRLDLGGTTLWIYDLERGIHTKFHEERGRGWARWTPDGQYIAFGTGTNGTPQIAMLKADGTDTLKVLVEGDDPSSWSPDGRQLAFVKSRSNGQIGHDILIATLGAGIETLRPPIDRAGLLRGPEFSPDGKWLMYSSTASGRDEVFVQPYPGPGPRQQVSIEGGVNPAWNPAGGEIFFLTPRGKAEMMVVDVRLGPTLRLGKPRRLFGFVPTCQPIRCYAVSPDGRYFYRTRPVSAVAPSPPPIVTEVNLITNWVEEMKAKITAGQAK